MVETTRLESERTRKGAVGSNPTFSAKFAVMAGIGRRGSLKSSCPKGRASSNLADRTKCTEGRTGVRLGLIDPELQLITVAGAGSIPLPSTISEYQTP